MKLFNTAFDILMRNEGGYSYEKYDSGGETYKGITRNYNPQWPGWIYIDYEIHNIKLKDRLKHKKLINHRLEKNKYLQKAVKEFYYKNYWKKLKLNKIYSKKLIIELFDKSVNMGIKQTVKLLQRALNIVGSDLVIDGIIGNKTIAEINRYKRYKKLVLKSYRGQLYIFYTSLLEKNKHLEKFIKGWILRI